MVKKTDLILSYVSDELVDKLFDIYNNLNLSEKHLTNNYFVYDPIDGKKVETRNTILTVNNQVDKLSDSFKQEIAKNFNFKYVHYLHIIEYLEDSKLDFHDHASTEHYSYTIYMDNNGGTEYKLDDGLLFIPAEKGKIVIFPSEVCHRAVIHNPHRFVAAGAIFRKINNAT
jgi:hypothetical protein